MIYSHQKNISSTKILTISLVKIWFHEILSQMSESKFLKLSHCVHSMYMNVNFFNCYTVHMEKLWFHGHSAYAKRKKTWNFTIFISLISRISLVHKKIKNEGNKQFPLSNYNEKLPKKSPNSVDESVTKYSKKFLCGAVAQSVARPTCNLAIRVRAPRRPKPFSCLERPLGYSEIVGTKIVHLHIDRWICWRLK